MKHSEDYPLNTRSMIGLEDEYSAGFVDPWHCHEHAQFLYASEGVMSVVTRSRSFVIPPQRGLWIPAMAMHEVACRNRVSLRTLYIDSAYDPDPANCRVLGVSNLLRELILELVKLPPDHDPEPRDERIIWLVLDEIERMPQMPFHVPMPSDKRLMRVCRAVIADPSDQRDIDAWSSLVGASRRSFTRSFRSELGMSFAFWRQQVRLMEAVSLLATGRSVTSVAFDVGYDSASAFTAAFRRTFGEPPSAYVSHDPPPTKALARE